MVQKAEITVEHFSNGITLRWKDLENASPSSKALATNGQEALIIGKEVWNDVSDIFDNYPFDEVIIKLEYIIKKK